MNLIRKSVIGTVPQNDNKLSEELRNASSKMLILIDDFNNLTVKTKEVLFARFVNHLPIYSLERLCFDKNSKRLKNEFSLLSKDLHLFDSDRKYGDASVTKVVNDLREAYKHFEICLNLVECNKNMAKASTYIQRRQHNNAVPLLNYVLASLEKVCHSENWKEIVLNMRKLASLKRIICVSKLCTEWEECLSWEEKRRSDKVILSISILECDPTHTEKIMRALSKDKLLESALIPFSEFFIDKILSVLMKKSCIISCEETMNFVHLVIEHSFEDEKNPQVQVFIENVIVVFEFLQLRLNFELDNNETFLSILAKLMSKRFFEFVDQYFKSAVPSDMSHIKDFDLVSNEIEVLYNFLLKINFTHEAMSPLFKYFNSSESLIHKKKCEQYLSEAKAILLENFQHNIVVIGSEENSNRKMFLDAGSLETPFLLPAMKISCNAKQLMELVLRSLVEASKCTGSFATDLVLTAKNMFGLFSSLVPYCQEQNLRNNPLDVALFHNNCYYLSHCMLSSPWEIKLEQSLVDSLNVFNANEIRILKIIADNTFYEFLTSENKFIVNSFTNIEMKSRELCCGLPDFDEAIAGVQTRLSSLRRQWFGVLSAEKYTTSMEDLLKSVFHSVLNCLIRIEQDGLPMESSSALAICLESALHCPQIVFEDPPKPLKAYSKLMDIVNLLRYPRRAVFEEKLSSEVVWKTFSKSEMKFLVKLVFPVGAVRSALIGKIQ